MMDEPSRNLAVAFLFGCWLVAFFLSVVAQGPRNAQRRALAAFMALVFVVAPIADRLTNRPPPRPLPRLPAVIEKEINWPPPTFEFGGLAKVGIWQMEQKTTPTTPTTTTTTTTTSKDATVWTEFQCANFRNDLTLKSWKSADNSKEWRNPLTCVLGDMIVLLHTYSDGTTFEVSVSPVRDSSTAWGALFQDSKETPFEAACNMVNQVTGYEPTFQTAACADNCDLVSTSQLAICLKPVILKETKLLQYVLPVCTADVHSAYIMSQLTRAPPPPTAATATAATATTAASANPAPAKTAPPSRRHAK